ncbi:acyltransferase family protein [Nocardioides sp. R-C-SC26]|uniref:acyltransferase family protein n=1 Tax=Nocardioides sp. R-C-SC26 TaxID=2870414 RepID=UPI001E2F813A|nr:acyltransferase family protein [Nocardioides sp. R-C-SC26]
MSMSPDPPAAPAVDDRRSRFRDDVQGLRAIAVLTVIAAHSGVSWTPGGFVGVDVFFVVSGYLITRLILTGIETDGRFRIGTFYARRARRIMPAATVVLLAAVAVSLIYLNFLEAIDAAQDAIWAAFFGANIRFATEGVDYFALEDAPSPVQHYWSLAVEEQFYLVWPVLIGLACLLTFRRARDRAPVKTVAFFALALGAASLAWSIHRTVEEPTSAYFSTFTRAWELAIGALLATALHRGRAIRFRFITEPLALAGLIGIGIAVVGYDSTMAFPGYEALLPVLATAGLLLAGAHPTRTPWTSRLLATRPFRSVGDWSYSLYLWHWPALVIPRVALGRELTVTETVIAVALTFQLAYLTYRFVEQPFRTGTFWRVRPRLGVVLYPASLALVIPAALGSQAYAEWEGSERGDAPAITSEAFGMSGRDVTDLVEASVQAGLDAWPIPSNLTPDLLDLKNDIADVGDCNYQRPERPLCRRGDVDSDRVIVVTGDSHARAWIPALEQIAEEAGYATYYLVKQQCTAAFVDPGQLGTGDPWPECEEFHDWVVEQVSDIQPDLMIFAMTPPPTGVYDGDVYYDKKQDVSAVLEGGYDAMYSAYAPYVDEMVLLTDVPRLPSEPGTCLAERDATLGDCMFPPTEWSEEMRVLSEDAARRNGVEAIDPTPWLCADDLCPVVIGSTIAWRDRGHISATRAAELWVPLGVELGLLEDTDRGGRKGRRDRDGG